MANTRTSAPLKREFTAAEVAAMFPIVDLGYNREHDRQEVEQIGGIDLCKAVATNSVPGTVSSSLLAPNMVAEPGLLMPRPHDIFERVRQIRYVHDHLADSVDDIQRALAEKSLEKTANDSAPSAPVTE